MSTATKRISPPKRNGTYAEEATPKRSTRSARTRGELGASGTTSVVPVASTWPTPEGRSSRIWV